MHHTMNRRAPALAPIGVAVLALALAGCSSTRFGGDAFTPTTQPAALPAAPSGNVQSGQLPPAVASGPGNIQPIGPDGTQPGLADPAQTAALDPAAQNPAATDPTVSASVAAPSAGLPVTENSLVGNWTASVGGGSCSAFFGLTNLGSGLLGGTRGCGGSITNFRTWQVAGNTATLRDSAGGTVATLQRTGDKTFSGTTASGEPLTLTR